MPLYSYHCTACDDAFETLVRSSETPTCPACGSDRLERLVSLPAAEGKLKGVAARARAVAAREGHFSNYSKSEVKRR
jgi:putative regulatory protein, FmdB family